MNTSIMCWRKVSSTAPMTGRISPWATPSFSPDLTIRCHLFHQYIARGQVHEHQHHVLEEGLIDGPNDRSYLAMGDAVLLPRSDDPLPPLPSIHSPWPGP